MEQHNPALPKPLSLTTGDLMAVHKQFLIFNPVLPSRGENKGSLWGCQESGATENKTMLGLQPCNIADNASKTLLTATDISVLLNEHVHTLEEAIKELKSPPHL